MKIIFSSLFRWLDQLRRLLINTLFVLVMFIIIVALLAEQPGIPDRAALVVNPTGEIVEELTLPSAETLPLQMGLASHHQTRLHDLIHSIELAATDDRIRLMVLKLDGMDRTSLPKLQELRRAINVFKASGKRIIATGPNYTQSQYYLAAAADQVFLNPLGVVALQGFSIYRNYIKDALARLHINIQLFKAGEYKAAAEPMVRNDMSDIDRASNRILLETLWSTYKNDLAGMRQIKAARIQTVLDHPSIYLAKHGGSLAELAKAEGLVDTLADEGEIEAHIAGELDVSGDYPSITFREYLQASNGEYEPESEHHVGIITASGMILDGELPSGSVGSKTMAQMLKQAREDDQIKAVVLRIDSPGGSAPASEAIRSEIQRLKETGKPIVVSMSSMAASGGYWIAAPADEIWAYPTTITGSIGAYAVLADFEQGLEKLGVHSDGLGTTSVAGGIRADRQLPPELTKVMQLSIQHIYGRFLNIVSEGRNMSEEKVAGLAEGRVWTGLEAKKLGLVDHLGGFDEAIAAAAKRAGLGEDYGKVWIRPPQNLKDIILAELFGNADTLFSGMIRQVGDQLLSYTGLSASNPWLQNIGQLSQLMGFSAGQPGIFAICNLRIE
jgi:protease-4